MTTAAIGAINLYQQFLSPYKGFRCAHRVKHGRMSCSQFAKRLIEKVGLFRFAPILMRRLRSCGRAARALRASASLDSVDKDKKDHAKRRQESSCDGCDGGVPDFGGCDTPSTPDGCAGLEGASACDGASGCDGVGCDFSI